MTAYPYGETLTLNSREVTGQDVLGNDVYAERPITLTNVPVWPTGSSEDTDARDTTFSDLTCVLPEDTDVEAVDSVTYGGVEYEIVGIPDKFVNPFTGFRPGRQTRLKRVTG